ncbi:hypothetical protein HZ326_29041 [Fusarium oxysporum f. sp. albedinis]|nr:hypothetical protein HZ326_29041 [Fusarium oxysporum f. sp. albedinis]
MRNEGASLRRNIGLWSLPSYISCGEVEVERQGITWGLETDQEKVPIKSEKAATVPLRRSSVCGKLEGPWANQRLRKCALTCVARRQCSRLGQAEEEFHLIENIKKHATEHHQ